MIHLGVDCVASMMEQFFNDPKNLDLPNEWESFDVEGRPIFLQYSTVNTDLESAADELLGEKDQGLMRGVSPDDELSERISMLGLSDDDFPEKSECTSSTEDDKKKNK